MEIIERSGIDVVQSQNRGYILPGGQSQITSLSGDVLEEQNGEWTVRDLETGIFGSGSDPASAMDDFQAALREHCDVLERQDALTDELAAQLRYLRVRLA